PVTDMPMRVVVEPFALPGREGGAVAIALGMRHPAPAAGEHVQETVELLSTAFDPRGRLQATRKSTASLTLRAVDSGGDARYEVLSRLDLPRGRYMLRFGLHSSSLDSSGSVYSEVEIPDFVRDPVSLSGVVITVSPGITSAPKDILGSLVPVTPTTQREFRN